MENTFHIVFATSLFPVISNIKGIKWKQKTTIKMSRYYLSMTAVSGLKNAYLPIRHHGLF
jgi:hypothetical protein